MSQGVEADPRDWEEYARALGRRLQAARGNRTQEAVAQQAGMSRPYYHGLEHGRWRGKPAAPSLLVLIRVASALNVDVSDLLPPSRGVDADA